jgi:hypothetical protein
MTVTAAEMLTELRLLFAERRDAIERLKNPEEATRRSKRLPVLEAIGKFLAANEAKIDEMLAGGAK